MKKTISEVAKVNKVVFERRTMEEKGRGVEKRNVYSKASFCLDNYCIPYQPEPHGQI